MKHLLGVLSIVLILISCDKDFNTVGNDLVGEENFVVETNELTTVATEGFMLAGVHPVQTDNLPYNVLGYYNDPIYGNTNANVLSQVGLSEYGKDFGDNPVITKVIFSMPYFSNKTETNADGEGTYALDSVYGNGKMKISLYKSDYFLNDFDPNTNFEDRQKYYSTDDAIFAPHSFGNASNLIFEKDQIEISADEVEIKYVDADGDDQVAERLSPRLIDSVAINTASFDWLLDSANSNALSSASEFENFYRGIYIKAEPDPMTPNDGTFFGVNLAEAEIEVFHGKLLFDDNGSPIDNDGIPGQDIEGVGSIKLLFQGNKVNTFTDNISYTPDSDKIYLRGGQGAMVKIDLFNPNSDDDRTSTELTDIQNDAEDWIINEANIEFYVADDVSVNANSTEPERIFLYDIDNSKVLVDYFGDLNTAVAVNSIPNHLGRLERDELGNGVKYTLKITEHINNIIKKDSTNVKLGLVVSNNVNLIGTSDIKDVTDPESIMSSSIVSHQGTVLYNENAIEPKKLKLKIHYSKIN